jgi:hypothetical protein
MALFSVRFTQLWLRPAEHLSHLPLLAVTAVLAEERQPPVKETSIQWLLDDSGTAGLGNGAAGPEMVHLCWLIEHYHYILKGGCRVESLQLDRFERSWRSGCG